MYWQKNVSNSKLPIAIDSRKKFEEVFSVKKCILFAYMAVLVLFLFGCEFQVQEDSMDLTQEEIDSANHTVLKNVSGSSTRAVETMLIYTIDDVEGQLVPLRVPIVSERVTPELVVDEVLKNIDEKVVVSEIDVVKRQIFVSFSDEYAPIQKCTKKFETLILDCISNSLLDNISYVDEVVFRSEKGNYHSSNFTFGSDEVYSRK